MMKKVLPWLIFILFTAFIGISLLAIIDGYLISISYDSQIISPILPKNKTISIILVGDIMLDRGVEYIVEKEGGGDYRFPFLKIADYLNKADIVFGNLEGPISDKGAKVGSIYSFRAVPKAIEGLTYAGFNVISLANNHAFDYGRQALEDCLTRFSNTGIDYVGAGFSEDEAYSPLIKEIKNTKIGFLAYTNLGPETWRAVGGNSGIAWVNESLLNSVKQQIEKAKNEADVLIVSLHAGEEYQKTPSQFQIDFFKMAAESGADIVFGHHPHVVQPDLYSLGNFVFDQGFSQETMQGQIIKVIIKNRVSAENEEEEEEKVLFAHKKIEGVIPIDIKINELFQPETEQ